MVFAVTQNIDGAALSLATDTELQRRRMKPFEQFIVPSAWGSGYAKQCKLIPHCADYRTVELATGLASRLIDPVLSGEARGQTWSAAELRWQ